MAEGYTKLFSDIVDSSIWDEDPAVCKVWVTMLALANADGFVRGSVGWLASKAKVSELATERAIQKFISPDERSRNPANEGRRIEAVEFGWLILNHGFFRDRYRVLSTDHRKTYQREWVRRKRLGQVSTESTTVDNDRQISTMIDTASASVNKGIEGTGEKGKSTNGIWHKQKQVEAIDYELKRIGTAYTPEDKARKKDLQTKRTKLTQEIIEQ